MGKVTEALRSRYAIIMDKSWLEHLSPIGQQAISGKSRIFVPCRPS